MTRKLALLLVVAAVVLGGGVGLAIAAAEKDGTPTPATHSRTPSGDTHPHPGPGWFLAAMVTRPAKSTPTTRLELVAPDGAIHPAFAASGDFLPVAWSGDGQRVVLVGTLRPTGKRVIEVVDLFAGRVTPVALPAGSDVAQVVGFTRPEGLALLTMRYSKTGGILERRSLAGADPVILATKVGGGAVVSTADGQALLVAQGNEIRLVSNRGSGAPTPIVASTGCVPVRLWSTTELLAECGEYGTSTAGTGQLERLPLAGGATHIVARDTPNPLAVNTDAYVARGGIYARTEGACGSGWISRVAADGTISRLSTPNTPPFAYELLTSNGTDLALIVTDGDCTDGQTSLVWMNPQTRSIRTLISVPKGRSAGFLPFSTYDDVN